MPEMTAEERMKQAVWLAAEAEKWLKTPLGQYIMKRVEQERADAMLRLRTVDPEDAKEIRRLQGDIKRAESFPAWISELIHEGDRCFKELEVELNNPME